LAIDLGSSGTSLKFIAVVIGLTAAMLALTFGASLLIPIIVAFILTNVLEALIERMIERINMPSRIAIPISVMITFLLISAFVYVIVDQADEFIAAWPRYFERLRALAESMTALLGQDIMARLQARLSDLDLAGHISSAIGSAGAILLNAGLVLLYAGFLLAERGRIFNRLVQLSRHPDEKEHVATVLTSVSRGIRQYLFVKTVMSLLTAATSYTVLRYLELDFAETWALIIFFLNYIPSIGSALGVVFPALLALVQFDAITSFIVIAIGLAGLQFAIGNILEPTLMGRSLNLSPFVIIVSLAFWSTIWGIAGAFLAVPITAAIVILCREIKGWEWVAMLLSNAESKSHNDELVARHSSV